MCSLLPQVQHLPCLCFLSTTWLNLHCWPLLQPWSVRKNLQGAPLPFPGDPSPPVLSAVVVDKEVPTPEGAVIAFIDALAVEEVCCLVLPRKATCSNSDNIAWCRSSTDLWVGLESTSSVYLIMFILNWISPWSCNARFVIVSSPRRSTLASGHLKPTSPARRSQRAQRRNMSTASAAEVAVDGLSNAFKICCLSAALPGRYNTITRPNTAKVPVNLSASTSARTVSGSELKIIEVARLSTLVHFSSFRYAVANVSGFKVSFTRLELSR